MSKISGTPYYIAPEVLSETYDEKCDVWSCGVILYILLCGYPPFNGETDKEILKCVKAGKFDFSEEEWKHISKEAKELISKMLTYEPSKRYSADDCLKHCWFKKEEKLLDSKLSKNAIKNMQQFKVINCNCFRKAQNLSRRRSVLL